MEEKIWHAHYDNWVAPVLDYPHQTIYEIFAQTSNSYQEKTAIIFMDGEFTYRQLKDLVDSFATALSGLGVSRGDRIVLSLPNIPQFIIAYYALMKLGAIVVMLNPLSTEREVQFKCVNSGARGIIGLDALFDIFYPAAKESGLDLIICTGLNEFHPSDPQRGTKQHAPDVLNMRSIIEQSQPGTSPVNLSQNDIAVIIYSGGTTGDPKGAMLSHRNIIRNAWMINTWGKGTPEDRGIAILPLFHGYGMQVMMNCYFLNGGSVILVPQFDITVLFEQIHRHRPTVIVGVPTMYVAMNTFPDINKYDLSCLRLASSGGAPLPFTVKHEFERITGGILVEGYGLTEATCACCLNPISGLNKEGTIGIPISDTDMKIVDIETGKRELNINEVGEIIVKCPGVMVGYCNNPDETENAIRDGWLYTGDIGTMDEDGYFSIMDRKKEMIIAGGFNIYPKEVENVIQSHPAILETAVIGLPDEYRGETVKAFIAVKPEMQLTEDEIIEYCKENMLRYMIPKIVEFRDQLPKSPIGKILKKELKAEELARLKGEG